MNYLLSIFLDYDAWVLAIYFGTLLFSAWLGCWIATWRSTKKGLTFRNTLVRGFIGGSLGSLLHPINAMVVVTIFAQGQFWNAYLTTLIWLGIGAVLALPLALTLAFRRTDDN